MARPPKIDDEQVLDRAMAVFWRHGWSSTSIRQLEAELDLKAPSIYRRYGSKEGLTRAVLERYLDRVIGGRIERYLSGEGDPIDNIRAFLDSALTPPPDGRSLVGCLLTVTALDHPTAEAELGDLLTRGLATIEAGLTAEAERAAATGRLADWLAPATAAAQLAVSFQGLMVLARSGVAPVELRRRAAVSLDAVTVPPRPVPD
ncbi:MAG: TetR/AcrR family transcriptional regulator [Actinomycetota bacterium]